MDVLDVGCGPGTITVGLAKIVGPGHVTGIDASAAVISQAKAYAERECIEAKFAQGDIYGLEFDDASFDVVHLHQVLQHLAEPTRALRELRRVLRPGGILAARDCDYSSFSWGPLDPKLDRWLEIYRAVARRNGGEPDAARFLKQWVADAGFSNLRVTSSTWTHADRESCGWLADVWADRISVSPLAEQAIAYGLATQSELDGIAAAWRTWASHPHAVFYILHGEILARA
jgi:ubiquinone/menaquinone biosynthesis C-methylase UbiE